MEPKTLKAFREVRDTLGGEHSTRTDESIHRKRGWAKYKCEQAKVIRFLDDRIQSAQPSANQEKEGPK